MPEVLRALRDAPPLETVLQPYLESDRMPSFLNKLMFANLRLKGPGYMLAKVEFLIGSCGLEGRYPLFDRRIVDYSFAIPPRYKLFGTTEKFVLKLAVQDLLPEEIVDRPKSGMRMPMHHWLTGPLRDLAAGLLLDPICRSRGLFREDMLRAWLGGDGLLFRRHGQRLWLVMTLEAWLRSYVDNLEITPYRPSRRRMWGLFPIHLPGTRRGEQSPSATVHGNTSL
jgi:asparagine synthase (glutamine-hydrolysing)